MEREELRRLMERLVRGESRIAEGIIASRVCTAGPPEGSMTGTAFVVMAQGSKRMAVGERVFEYGAGQSLVTSVEVPVVGHFFDVSPERPALGFAMTLRPAVIAELLLLRPPAHRPVPAGIAVADASPEILDAVGRMVRLLERPGDRAALAPLIERELHWLALTGPLGGAVRQLALADRSLHRVGQAVGWIREHYAESFRVADLARRARMSTSAFHRSFQAITALSPIQYQKQLRLQEARIRLVADPSDVAGAAHAVGYESASQFSREYRRQFGSPPTRDIARLRAPDLAEGVPHLGDEAVVHATQGSGRPDGRQRIGVEAGAAAV